MSTTDSRPDHDSSALLGLGSSAGLGPTRFAPTVTMPGGGVVTPEGWMWVMGFALAGCEWAIEAAERDNLHEKAMDYRRRQRIYWQEREVSAAEARLARERKKLAALVGPNVELTGARAAARGCHLCRQASG